MVLLSSCVFLIMMWQVCEAQRSPQLPVMDPSPTTPYMDDVTYVHATVVLIGLTFHQFQENLQLSFREAVAEVVTDIAMHHAVKRSIVIVPLRPYLLISGATGGVSRDH